MPTGREDDDGWWHCESCDRDFNSRRAIESHFERSNSHSWCRDCDRDFVSDSARQSHYANSAVHNYCTLCHEDYGTWAELWEHRVEDHAPCTKCRKIFKGERGLHEHSRQSHADVWCVECRRPFRSPHNLATHLQSSIHVDANIPCPSKYSSSACSRYFVSHDAADRHLRSGACPSGMD